MFVASIPPLMIALALGAVIGYLAYRAGALNRGGSLAAALTGGLIFGLGGIGWAVLLLTFFISSSTLSRLFTDRKRYLSDKFSKGSRRDAAQVLANGGLGVLLVVLHALLPDQNWSFIAYAGAMATVNADTWATELGVLSSAPARLITTGKIVEQGTSGGVTLLGYLASLAGAALIAAEAGVFAQGNLLITTTTVVAGGLVGATFDSVLGARWQAIYYCPICQKETESHPVHRCGNHTSHLRGWRWLDNDKVNFFSAGVGALVSILIWWLFI